MALKCASASQMRDYQAVDQTDIDEIIEQHLQHGRVVERLKM
jgi:(2Fe-2S) ferredoxin